MKVLFIHADYLSYRVKEKTPSAEDIEGSRKKGSMDEPLITLISIESSDERSEAEKLAEATLKTISDVSSKIGVKNIALFPFAHLSEDLASPDFAVSVLKETESKLKEEGFNTLRVPFGWYKEFELKSKGHPLSVLSRILAP
ncbi:hypothetical protein AKJ57_00070 [candidate division MSBL1 archaeon SCGC-AAA259A05]|uniref:Threonyl-tRNA synthetase editing domain-containing protein n=1 Tax=candidate division MSBL1 archaeon SCGC-AAA259A05 TaxID=1698259 RepID=A0A133UC19_9EURY|nr:hypothetical protein AKJ57_00070 [candidate division MSBL1 archaeon SCGC-AAA259A05]